MTSSVLNPSADSSSARSNTLAEIREVWANASEGQVVDRMTNAKQTAIEGRDFMGGGRLRDREQGRYTFGYDNPTDTQATILCASFSAIQYCQNT
jgi:hypothetical protein